MQVAANLGYSFGMGEIFARPEIDGSVIGLRQHGFTEQGLNGLGVTGARIPTGSRPSRPT